MLRSVVEEHDEIAARARVANDVLPRHHVARIGRLGLPFEDVSAPPLRRLEGNREAQRCREGSKRIAVEVRRETIAGHDEVSKLAALSSSAGLVDLVRAGGRRGAVAGGGIALAVEAPVEVFAGFGGGAAGAEGEEEDGEEEAFHRRARRRRWVRTIWRMVRRTAGSRSSHHSAVAGTRPRCAWLKMPWR